VVSLLIVFGDCDARDQKRFHDIDWLRVIGMLLIFSFHNARFFNEEDWHVKNPQLDFGMTVYVAVLAQFIMPLFFVLSAIAIYFALKRRTGKEFMRERTSRLIIPLVFGIFTTSRCRSTSSASRTGSSRAHSGSSSRITSTAGMARRQLRLDGTAPVVPADAVPVFVAASVPVPAHPRCPGFHHSPGGLLFSRAVMIYLFFIPIMLMEFIVGLSPDTIGMRSFGGWSPFTYLVIFFLGYILATDERYRPAIERLRFFSLTLSLLLLAIGYSLEMADISLYSYYLAPFRGLNTWAWLMTFLGFASRHLNFSNKDSCNMPAKPCLPFYILHQTVIVGVGFFIRDWQLAVFPKYLFLAAVSFTIIMVYMNLW
jgi:glucans biosynthesis protein C